MMVQALPHYPSTGGDGGGGGAITFVGGKSSSFNGTGAPTTVSLTGLTGGIDTLPSQNDVVIVAFASYGGNQNLSVTGYTEQCDIWQDADANLGVYTKVMTATPDTSIELSALSDYAIVRVFVYRGVNTTTPMDVAPVTRVQNASSDAVVSAITPVTTGAVVIGAAITVVGNSLNATVMSDAGVYAPFLASKLNRMSSCLGALNWSGGAAGPYTVDGGVGVAADYATCALALRPA